MTVSRQFLCKGGHLLNTLSPSRGLLSLAGSYSSKTFFLQPVVVSNHVPKRSWHERSSYTVWIPDKPREKKNYKEALTDGLEIMRKGIPQWKEEWNERFTADYKIHFDHGDYEYFAKFNGAESMKDWVVSVDGDFDMGKSKATLTPTSSGSALFHGFLNTDLPKTDKYRASGYCNLRCPRKMKSFDRAIPYDWTRYTHMYLKVRGDGRNYMLNIQMLREFDLHWHDMYQYPLYTRGGPYWQIVKIPFSKFFMSHSGRVQDYQEPVNLEWVKYFSFSIMDNVAGRFQLEIDSIALVRDESQQECFEYEMYDTRYI